jgi:hypothetical protein
MIAHHAPARRAIFALALLCPWSPALADTCATAYHAALRSIGSERDVAMSQIGSRLRQPVDGTPGRWFTGLPQSSRGAQERPCLEVAVTRRRERCIRFAAPLPREVEALSRPSAEEQRALAGVSEVIRGRGVVTDLSNGRSAGILLRVAAEVRNYINQPANPALCAGGRDVVQFYLRSTDPVSARLAEVRRLSATITTMAAQRLRSAVSADAAQIARQAEATKASAPDQTAAPAANDNRPAPERTAPSVLTAETYAALTVPAMLTEAGRVVGVAGAADASSRSIVAAMKQISEALRSAPLETEVRATHWAALRMIEARYYADLLVSRYEDADTAVIGVLKDIRTAHQRHCTCGS